MSVTIVISENRTSATIAKTTPGPANRVARQPPSNAMPVRTTPTVAIVAPDGLERRQGLAAEDDRQDDRQAAVGGDHAAHDRDRTDAGGR